MKLIADGREAPKEFYEQPEIPIDQQFYWDAFFDLSTERQIGMALGPIPRSAISNYAAEFGIVGDSSEHFHRIIRALDNEYLTLTNSPKSKDRIVDSVSATDGKGVSHLFERMKNRARTGRHKPRKH